MRIPIETARVILEASVSERPLTELERNTLESLVPYGETKDFYCGLLSGIILAHGTVEGIETAEDIDSAAATLRKVAARTASLFID